NDLPLEGPIEIPLIIRNVLVVPNDLACIGIDGDRRVRIQSIVGYAGPAHGVTQWPGIVCRRRTEENKVQIRIVAPGRPHRAAVPLLERQTIPTVPARLVRP